jgi:hypothetical protein
MVMLDDMLEEIAVIAQVLKDHKKKECTKSVTRYSTTKMPEHKKQGHLKNMTYRVVKNVRIWTQIIHAITQYESR